MSVRGDAADLSDGLARGSVPEIQRARILAALGEIARERGAARVTVAHIVARSGVSRRTFYEMFEDRDACFLAAFENAVARGAARVVPAFEGGAAARRGAADIGGRHTGEGDLASSAGARAPAGWQARVRAGLLALLECLDEEPGLAALGVVDALGAGPVALSRRSRVVEALIDAVDEGRRVAKAGLRPTRLTAEGVVGGVLSVLYARLVEPAPSSRRAEPLVGLLNPLMGTIVLPYLGPAAAGREAARVAPKARPLARRPRSNPLEGLDMRLTYRTMCVLSAVGSVPDASNREVADAAGVQDQGQISKLLARLGHLGLVENSGAGALHGAPNAWRLTPRGREVELTIRQQAVPMTG
jgi:AcrR family transcriptional regulator